VIEFSFSVSPFSTSGNINSASSSSTFSSRPSCRLSENRRTSELTRCAEDIATCEYQSSFDRTLPASSAKQLSALPDESIEFNSSGFSTGLTNQCADYFSRTNRFVRILRVFLRPIVNRSGRYCSPYCLPMKSRTSPSAASETRRVSTHVSNQATEPSEPSSIPSYVLPTHRLLTAKPSLREASC
jgi:hypothetical protein